MAGFIDWVQDIFFKTPKKWVAELESNNFVESATMERSTEEGFSHRLVLRFSEPIRDGNPIQFLNLTDEDGSMINSLELYTGIEQYNIVMNPSRERINLVFVDDEPAVFAKDSVRFDLIQPDRFD